MPFSSFVHASLLVGALQTPNAHICLTGPRSQHLFAQIRARFDSATPGETPYGIPFVRSDQIGLVRDDSLCAAVSRVLPPYVRSGLFTPQTQKPPFPVMVVRVGSKFLLHDSISDTVYTGDSWYTGDRFFDIDTLVRRPVAPHVMTGSCPSGCCKYGPWTLRTRVTLRRESRREARTVGDIPAGVIVDADTGIVVVDSLGLITARAPVVRPVSSNFVLDTIFPGDTVLTLVWEKAEDNDNPTYVGWWRGQITQFDRFWDPARPSAPLVVREPRWTWWVHMSATIAGKRLSGWVNMNDRVEVIGNCWCD